MFTLTGLVCVEISAACTALVNTVDTDDDVDVGVDIDPLLDDPLLLAPAPAVGILLTLVILLSADAAFSALVGSLCSYVYMFICLKEVDIVSGYMIC